MPTVFSDGTTEMTDDEMRVWRRNLESLPGMLHEFGKTIVVFAHPKKVAYEEAQWREIATLESQREIMGHPSMLSFDVLYARLRCSNAWSIAWVPMRHRSGVTNDIIEVMKPRRLGLAWYDVNHAKKALRSYSALALANASDISWCTGLPAGSSILPWCTRAHLLRYLNGECAMCGNRHSPGVWSKDKANIASSEFCPEVCGK